MAPVAMGVASGANGLQSRALRIGTRGSPLALRQAGEVRDRLVQAHQLNVADIEIVPIKTSGDRVKDRAMRAYGNKGLFTKEIEEALSGGEIDLAVHSMKDLPSELPEGLEIACLLPREDVRDAFISPHAASLGELAEGAVVGTSSLRRQAQVKRMRPDINVVELRGNVETRLRKLADNVADATILAYAGMKRLGQEDRITAVMEPGEMLPAAAQGAIGVEIRDGDDEVRTLLAAVNDTQTALCIGAERAFLIALDGSCRTPIAALATLERKKLRLRGMILTPDGGECHETARKGAPEDGEALGRDAAEELLKRAGPNFFAALE